MDHSADLQRRMADALRMLAVDAIDRANSGHPGAPMGMADIAQVLWHGHLRHNPANPKWPNRDRFVLSNGHASMQTCARQPTFVCRHCGRPMTILETFVRGQSIRAPPSQGRAT